MIRVQHFLAKLVFAVLIGLPLLSLGFNVLSWLRYGLDLPFYDDWRGYASGDIHSLELSYLFRPVNSTLTPIGFGLDALAQRFLDGNPIPYQFLSMVGVLGGLLWMQWRLLTACIADRWVVASCFVWTLLMLQPGSYWGRENMAFHQALPLLCLLAALLISLRSGPVQPGRMLAVFVLGLLSGFSYISGAFAAAACGLAMVLLAGLQAGVGRVALLKLGAALTSAGVFTSLVQLFVAVDPGRETANHLGIRLAMPWDHDFWWYILGKIGRALALAGWDSFAGMAASMLVVVVLFCLLLWGARRFSSDTADLPGSGRPAAMVTVALSLSAAVAVYLCLVAAGRTFLRPAEVVTAVEVFKFGFYRFHFFWITLLWPWVLALGWLWLKTAGPVALRPHARRVMVVLGFVGVFHAFYSGAVSHAEAHRDEAHFRLPTIQCLSEQLQRGQGIECVEFNMPDFSPAYNYGLQTGASFVRHFPILPIPFGADDPKPLFRLSENPGVLRYLNASNASKGKENAGIRLVALDDPGLLIDVSAPAEMAGCARLDVAIELVAEQEETAQLFFIPRGGVAFDERHSQTRPVPAAQQKTPTRINFTVTSSNGFESLLRVDPIRGAGQVEVGDLEIRCRWRLTATLP